MGNCIILENVEQYNRDVLCEFCNSSDLGMEYIYCAYCGKRFHTRCSRTYNTGLKNCGVCNKSYLRLIRKSSQNKI